LSETHGKWRKRLVDIFSTDGQNGSRGVNIYKLWLDPNTQSDAVSSRFFLYVIEQRLKPIFGSTQMGGFHHGGGDDSCKSENVPFWQASVVKSYQSKGSAVRSREFHGHNGTCVLKENNNMILSPPKREIG
jgi:hypothetical protein